MVPVGGEDHLCAGERVNANLVELPGGGLRVAPVWRMGSPCARTAAATSLMVWEFGNSVPPLVHRHTYATVTREPSWK